MTRIEKIANKIERFLELSFSLLCIMVFAAVFGFLANACGEPMIAVVGIGIGIVTFGRTFAAFAIKVIFKTGKLVLRLRKVAVATAISAVVLYVSGIPFAGTAMSAVKWMIENRN